jgi:diacylglycerol kinase (ATP)
VSGRRKAKLIMNPVAGTDAGPDHLRLINEGLREAVDSLDFAMTRGPGDATQLAKQATEDGYDQLFVAGGDGTLNEVLNGVAQVPGGWDAVTFGVIPLGTGNDFATAVGIPEDIEGAVQALARGSVAAVDVGCLNEAVYFVNVSAGGFMAEVSDAVTPRLKTFAGKLAYLIGGAQVLFDYEPVKARITRPIDLEISLHTFAVCNSPLVGGGRLIAPEARLDDGWADVCLIEAMATIDFLALLTRVSSGEHVNDQRVRYFRATDVELTFDRTIAVNTDGQVLETDACRYRIFRHAARFLVPATANLASSP